MTKEVAPDKNIEISVSVLYISLCQRLDYVFCSKSCSVGEATEGTL